MLVKVAPPFPPHFPFSSCERLRDQELLDKSDGSSDSDDEDGASVSMAKPIQARHELGGPTAWMKMLDSAFSHVLGPRKQDGRLLLETGCSGTGSVAYGLRVFSSEYI